MSINEKIKLLTQEFNNNYSCTPLEKLEKAIEEYLKEHPDDVEMTIRLALAVYTRPLADDPKAVECLERVPSTHFLYPKAILIQAYIEEGWRSIGEEQAPKLLACKSNNKDEEAMLYYMASRCYYDSNIKYRKELLLKSVSASQKMVANYLDLGDVCLEEGDWEEAHQWILHGLANLQQIGSTHPTEDVTDIDNFIDNCIKMIKTSKPLFEITIEHLQEILEHLNNPYDKRGIS